MNDSNRTTTPAGPSDAARAASATSSAADAARASHQSTVWRRVAEAAAFVIIGLALIHALAAVAVSAAPRPNDTFFRDEQRNLQRILNSAPSLHALAIGNSHTASLDFEILGADGDSLVRAWEDLFQIQYTLDAIIPRLPSVDTVYIPISFFSFAWDNAASLALGTRRMNVYTAVPSWRFINGDFVNFVMGKSQWIAPTLAIMREDNWAGVFAALMNPREAVAAPAPDAEKSQSTNGAEPCVGPSAAALREIAIKRVEETKTYSDEMKRTRPDVETASFDALSATIDSLRSLGIRVVLFTPPYYAAYTDTLKHEMGAEYAKMHELVNALKARGVEYYDFSEDAEISMNAVLFKDSDHMNDCGRRAFSLKLKSAMDEARAEAVP